MVIETICPSLCLPEVVAPGPARASHHAQVCSVSRELREGFFAGPIQDSTGMPGPVHVRRCGCSCEASRWLLRSSGQYTTRAQNHASSCTLDKPTKAVVLCRSD